MASTQSPCHRNKNMRLRAKRLRDGPSGKVSHGKYVVVGTFATYSMSELKGLEASDHTIEIKSHDAGQEALGLHREGQEDDTDPSMGILGAENSKDAKQRTARTARPDEHLGKSMGGGSSE